MVQKLLFYLTVSLHSLLSILENNNFFTSAPVNPQKINNNEKDNFLSNDLLYERFSEILFDEMNKIPKLWEELGVTDFYKLTFVNVVMELDISVRKEYFEHEIANLTQFQDQLKVRRA